MSIRIASHDHALVVDEVGAVRPDRLLLTEQDATRLRAAVVRTWRDASPDGVGLEAALLLAAALRTAVVVPPEHVPRDVVTMRSRLVLKDVLTADRREVALVYPEDQHDDGTVSVLSPRGVALLGLSEGALIAWPRRGEGPAVLRVESIRYQPESAGEPYL